MNLNRIEQGEYGDGGKHTAAGCEWLKRRRNRKGNAFHWQKIKSSDNKGDCAKPKEKAARAKAGAVAGDRAR